MTIISKHSASKCY